MRHHFRYRATGISYLLALGLALPSARAQEPDGGRERAAAEALFEAGHAAMDDGDFDTACQKFQASMELDPAPGTLMNLGNCEEKRGHVASAWERYIAAQRDLPESDRRRQFAQHKVVELEPSVPRLTLVLADGAPDSTEVKREDIDLTGSIGVALPLDPGSYSIRVSAPGYEERDFDVELALGEQRELQIYPGDRMPDPAPVSRIGAEEPRHFGPLTKREWGYVAGAVGVVGVGTALTMGALAYKKKRTMAEHCNSVTLSCDGTGDDARQAGATFATVADVAGGIGLAALGAGIYLVLTGDDAEGGVADVAAPHFSGGGLEARLQWVTLPAGQALQVTGEFW
jgi:tetratricopeptide (TPR) repeat protein